MRYVNVFCPECTSMQIQPKHSIYFDRHNNLTSLKSDANHSNVNSMFKDEKFVLTTDDLTHEHNFHEWKMKILFALQTNAINYLF